MLNLLLQLGGAQPMKTTFFVQRGIVATGVLTVLMGLPLIALAEDGVTPGQLLIGQSISLQDGKNEYGAAVQDGIYVYLNKVNAQGGIHGRQLVLKTLDDKASSAQAQTNARALVEKDKVFLVFGSIEGGPSIAAMTVAAELKVPFFGPIAGAPTLRRPFQSMVFPVRAEHREEFKALMEYSKRTGGSRVAFVRSDSKNGLQHLENVKLLCKELGMELVADLPYKPDVSEAQLDAMVDRLASTAPHLVFNHGGIDTYEKLIRKTRAKGLTTHFNAVNSGSAELAKHLGTLAQGMVFSQVVPSPWERKTEITREYQEALKRYKPAAEFSYGSLEGYITAKALVAALRLAGPTPTRSSFVQGLYSAGSLDINGLHAVYRSGAHTGLSLVDLSIVATDGKFRH
jgi:ABC-type branched-subunit amino acid transport system substrate-binding protein